MMVMHPFKPGRTPRSGFLFDDLFLLSYERLMAMIVEVENHDV